MNTGRLMVVADETVLTDRDFRNFFLRSPIERMIVSVEPDGRFVFTEVNAAAAAYFEIPREKMLGRAPGELFEAQVAEHIASAYAACARTKKSMIYNALPRFQ